MKNRLLIAIIIMFVLQIVLLILIFRPVADPTTLQRTPIPTLPRATLPPASNNTPAFGAGECRVAALTLIGSWVEAGKPDSEPFPFQGANGDDCQATFEQDVHPLFDQSNIWYSGSVACTACHGEPLNTAAAQLDLSTYETILSGSRRASETNSGEDILGSAETWESSKLYVQVFTRQMPMGRPRTSPPEGPVIRAGVLVEE